MRSIFREERYEAMLAKQAAAERDKADAASRLALAKEQGELKNKVLMHSINSNNYFLVYIIMVLPLNYLCEQIRKHHCKSAIQIRRDAQAADIEGIRLVKRLEERHEARRREILLIDREKSLLAHRMKASQWKNDTHIRHQNSTAVIESLRCVKSKALGEQVTFSEHLVSSRQKSEYSASVKADQKLKEEALRHAASQAETNGLRLVKASAATQREQEQDLLANERDKAQYNARVKADQKLKEEALRHAASQAETNGLRLVKASAARQNDWQRGCIDTAVPPNLNDMLDIFGLGEYRDALQNEVSCSFSILKHSLGYVKVYTLILTLFH